MHWNASIKHRLVLGFGCILALIAAVVSLIGFRFAKMREASDSIAYELVPRIRAANALAEAIDHQRNGLRGFILTGEPEFHDRFTKSMQNQQAAVADLRALLTDAEQRAMLAGIEAQLAELRQEEARIIGLLNNGSKDAAFRYHQEALSPLSEEITRMAGKIASRNYALADAAASDLRRATNLLSKFTWGSLGMAALLAVLFIVITVRSVTRPAKTIAQAADAIAKGDYSKSGARDLYCLHLTASATPRNELYRIALSMDRMACALERRERLLAAHADIGDVCASTIEIGRVVDAALDELASHTHSQSGVVYLAHEDKWQVGGTFGISAETAETILTGPEGFVEQAARSGRPIVLSNIPDDTRFLVQPGLGKIIPKSIACLPMMVEGQAVGVIALASLHAYDEETLSLMETSAAQIGIAVSNCVKHSSLQKLAEKLRDRNELLDAQNEELQCQNEEIQAQSEEIQAQNEELAAQSAELQERNRELEVITRDLIALQSVTSVALSSLDREELLQRMLESVTEALGLQFGLVMVLDDDGNTLRAHAGYNVLLGRERPLESRFGEGFAGRVAESRQIISISDAQTEPLLINPHLRQTGVRALIGVPLTVSGVLFGVALLGTSEAREFSDREKHLLEVFGMRTAVALERAQSYEKLKTAEEQARSERERLQAIIDNLPEGVIIITAPDGRPYMANKVALSLYGLDALPDTMIKEHAEAFNLYRTDDEQFTGVELPLSRSLLRGEECSGEEVVVRQPGGRRVVLLCNTAPIRDEHGNITGAIGVFQDITTIKEHQHMLERIYEHQRSIAETLQKSFLPSLPMMVAGYDIADAYVPAQEHTQVGGDFYDLIELGDGMLGVVIADVSGKGVDAAVYTAMAKYMLRAFAHEDPEPESVLTRLNDAITKYIHGEAFITLFYGVLYTNERRLVYANAGHEQPLLFRPRTREYIALDSTGPAVGIIPEGRYGQREIHLAEGDAFIMYTDGITEARSDQRFLGMDGLADALYDADKTDARGITNQILARVREFTGDRLSDDVALLVIKAGAAPGGGGQAYLGFEKDSAPPMPYA